MNRPDLYRKTVDILYEAYFNDTLNHGLCTACAVGNIVAANNGLQIRRIGDTFCWLDKKGKGIYAMWDLAFSTICNIQDVRIFAFQHLTVLQQIESTGYPWQELAKIEFAFETAPKGASKEDHMFNGLVAVLDVLQQLHEVDDNSADVERFETHRVAKNYK